MDYKKQDKNKNRKAVALRYKKGKDSAPKVVAKGVSEVAERIINVAEKENVPLIQDENAVNDFYGIDLNVEIPKEMYKVAAEILAYVYTMDKKNNPK